MEGKEVALSIAGDRKGPDHASLELARQLPSRMGEIKPKIAQALFEHYEPYREAHERGESPNEDGSFPLISNAEDVWPHTELAHVTIEFLRGAPGQGPVIEIALATSWDEEHTVGARIQGWRLFELCGSV